ncbi:hypothetical protein BAY61_15275 [Prauserella marina]|uniref:Uncharacterized protein n=1 Tax=Prauserella marina TaxID=530584 RepID=A0A222VQY2_9PSEU|nr:DUF3558 family protein [Prauserella marina]ASR36141.1 hypothetical protein BAY61_15275 [Prauserella marina]PWV76883.1 uncharacterized protein DUF3558 [Prauserella marina]SDC99660.1 Protein of unknown function [Prauserella marina]
MLLLIVMMAGCTSITSGSARPGSPPGAPNPLTGEPCDLLTAEEATAAGLVAEGDFTPGEPGNLLPPTCYWALTDELATGLLSVSLGTEFSLDQYMNWREPIDSFEVGGLTWHRYPDDAIAEDLSDCIIGTEFGHDKFVAMMNTDYENPSASCDLPKEAARYVSGHLPGGERATIPPSTPPPPTPLDGVDACSLLTPEQTGELSLSANGKVTSERTGCEWRSTDGDDGVKAMVVYVEPEQAAERWPYAEEPGQRTITARGHTWNVYTPYAESDTDCLATLSVTSTSSVVISGGDYDPAKSCAGVEAAVRMITEKLPDF